MGTAEEAMRLIAEQARRRGLKCNPVLAYQAEINWQCCKMLAEHTSSDSCIFKDVTQMARADTSSPPTVRQTRNQGFLGLLKRATARYRLPLTAFCQRHKTECVVPRKIDLIVGGNPCTDWSAAGLRKGFAGPTASCTLSFGRLLADSASGIQENVPNYPNIYEDATGMRCSKISFSPGGIGFGSVVQRPRTYRVLHKPGAELLFDPEELYKSICREFSGFDAHFSELLDHDEGTSADYKNLSIYHKRHLRSFRRLAAKRQRLKKNLVYHLGDNPQKRLCWTSTRNNALPTLRKGMGVLWSAAKKRQLRPATELRRMHGWRRSLPQAADGTEFSGMSIQRMLGNSMHLASAAAIVAVHLACTPATVCRQATGLQRLHLLEEFDAAVAAIRAGA